MAEKKSFSYDLLKNAGRIHARVLDEKTGLKEYRKVYAIRMLDEGVRRLLMNDYNPTLGKIIGDVAILSADGEHIYKNVVGFYKLQHNEFTLLIQSSAKEKAAQE